MGGDCEDFGFWCEGATHLKSFLGEEQGSRPCSVTGTVIRWYQGDLSDMQLNAANTTYRWFALG